MTGLQKERSRFGYTTKEMASELCVTEREYLGYENNIYSMPLPILKLASFILSKPTQYLLSEVKA